MAIKGLVNSITGEEIINSDFRYLRKNSSEFLNSNKNIMRNSVLSISQFSGIADGFSDDFEDIDGLNNDISIYEHHLIYQYVTNQINPSSINSYNQTKNRGGLKNDSLRNVIPSSDISSDGNAIRLTLHASDFELCNVLRVSIVERDGSTANGVEIPTVITFNGEEAFAIPDNDSIISDQIMFPINQTKDYLIIIDVAKTKDNSLRRNTSGFSYRINGSQTSNLQICPTVTRTYNNIGGVEELEIIPIDNLLIQSKFIDLVNDLPQHASILIMLSHLDDIDIETELLFEMTIDMGNNWHPIYLSKINNLIDDVEMWSGEHDFDINPLLSSDIAIRLKTLNNQIIEIYGWTITWQLLN